MATVKPEPMGQDDKLRLALVKFHASAGGAEDIEALLLAGSRVYRQGVGLSPEEVYRIVGETMPSTDGAPAARQAALNTAGGRKATGIDTSAVRQGLLCYAFC